MSIVQICALAKDKLWRESLGNGTLMAILVVMSYPIFVIAPATHPHMLRVTCVIVRTNHLN